jgi:hypothetical protein
MSSQDRSGWALAVICGVVGTIVGGGLGWGAFYLAAVYGRLDDHLGLGGFLAVMLLVPCVGAVAGAIAGTLGGLRISRRTRVGGGRKSDRD